MGVTTTRNTATSTRSHTRASEESNAKKQTHAVLDVRRRTKTKRTRTREKMLGPMMPTMGAMMRAASDVDSMFEHVMRDVGEGNFNFVRDGRAMRAMRGAIGRAKVEETKRGFLISAHAPRQIQLRHYRNRTNNNQSWKSQNMTVKLKTSKTCRCESARIVLHCETNTRTTAATYRHVYNSATHAQFITSIIINNT